MTRTSSRPELLQVWRFVRGDTSPKDFEHWICSSAHLEETLGPALYLELISADYRDRDAVRGLKQRLSSWAREIEELRCQCVTLPDLAVVDMGEAHVLVFATLSAEASRGEPFWWLSTYRCSACGEGWLVAQEERHNDVFCMRRLHAAEVAAIAAEKGWPTDFDRYEDLLRIGLDAGKAVDFVDPLNSPSLRWTIEDLATARPGIRLSELARLLHLDLDTASRLARVVVEAKGVNIQFDAEQGHE